MSTEAPKFPHPFPDLPRNASGFPDLGRCLDRRDGATWYRHFQYRKWRKNEEDGCWCFTHSTSLGCKSCCGPVWGSSVNIIALIKWVLSSLSSIEQAWASCGSVIAQSFGFEPQVLSDKTLHISVYSHQLRVSLNWVWGESFPSTTCFDNLQADFVFGFLNQSASSQSHSAPYMQAPSSKKGFYVSGLLFLLSSRHREGSPGPKVFVSRIWLTKTDIQPIGIDKLLWRNWGPKLVAAVSRLGCSALIGLRALKWAIWHMFEGPAAGFVSCRCGACGWNELYLYKLNSLPFFAVHGAETEASNWQRYEETLHIC